MTRTVIVNALAVLPSAADPVPVDVACENGVIVGVGSSVDRTGAQLLNGEGRLVMPGFIDAHSHADATVFAEDVQLSLLRQGITTVIGGQDGVGFAPGDAAYGTEYFGGINGTHPAYAGGGIGALLDTYDAQVPLNVGQLVPLGTVRFEVMGRSTSAASPDELTAMLRLITDGLDAGALGVSTGLDYVPGIFAGTGELTELCRPVAERDAVYVTHMRGGYEANAAVGVDEVHAIAQGSGVRCHISHYHGEPELLTSLIDGLLSEALQVTYDAYFYQRGCSLLAMPLLPPPLLARSPSEVVAALRDPASRHELVTSWFPRLEATGVHGVRWPHLMTLAAAPHPDWSWTPGRTVDQIATTLARSPRDVALDLLADTALQATCVMDVVNPRTDEQSVPLFTHRAHCGGSDGIQLGAHPHPRAHGAFPKYLRLLVRELGVWTWTDAVRHLATQTAQVHRLRGRGVLEVGAAADLVLIDGDTVADRATYENPTQLSVGIDDVLVAGVPVLRDGSLTGATPGRGLRRGPSVVATRHWSENQRDRWETDY